MNTKMNFMTFLEKWFPEYKIDSDNEEQIRQIGAWADRDENFSKMGSLFHLDRGLILCGGVGVGKTDIFAILNKYLREYMRSNYAFSTHVVWKQAGQFVKEGYSSFDEFETGNRYFDELCLTDDTNGQPMREYVQHYGNKLLIGSEIIMMRYNSFKRAGFQTHFSTNATSDQLRDIYKERAFDRLIEMCNFIVFTGESRRGMYDPNLHKNLNTPLHKFESAPVSDKEHEFNKGTMDDAYTYFLETGKISDMASIHYEILKSYKCDIAGEDVIEQYVSEALPGYVRPVKLISGIDGPQRERMELTPTENSANKRVYGVTEAKKRCVYEYYCRLKDAGAKSIFRQVDVGMSHVVTSIQK